MSRTQVQLWCKRFKEGQEDVNNDARPGRPTTILDNHQITIREVTDNVGILFGSWQAIFTDVLGIKRAAAKIFPKLLNFEQKQRRINIAQDMLTTFNDDPDLLKMVITGYDSWVYGYDINIKAQSFQWKHPEEPRP